MIGTALSLVDFVFCFVSAISMSIVMPTAMGKVIRLIARVLVVLKGKILKLTSIWSWILFDPTANLS
jgi:hypothetical protein